VTFLFNTGIVVLSIIGMEIFAWAVHKYIMHGPGWGWHESHHTETDGLFEKNEALPFTACFMPLFMTASFTDGSLFHESLAGNI